MPAAHLILTSHFIANLTDDEPGAAVRIGSQSGYNHARSAPGQVGFVRLLTESTSWHAGIQTLRK